MIQTLYAIIAIFMLAILSLTMNRSIHSNESKMILNEVSAQVTPIAMDILDYIGTLKYDPTLITDDLMVATPDNFAHPIEGSYQCTSQPGLHQGCYDAMNELHGKRVVREVYRDPVNPGPDSLKVTYFIDIEFDYLNPLNFTQVSSTPTFHKRATLTITSPELVFGEANTPFEITIERIFSYPRVTG